MSGTPDPEVHFRIGTNTTSTCASANKNLDASVPYLLTTLVLLSRGAHRDRGTSGSDRTTTYRFLIGEISRTDPDEDSSGRREIPGAGYLAPRRAHPDAEPMRSRRLGTGRRSRSAMLRRIGTSVRPSVVACEDRRGRVGGRTLPARFVLAPLRCGRDRCWRTRNELCVCDQPRQRKGAPAHKPYSAGLVRGAWCAEEGQSGW